MHAVWLKGLATMLAGVLLTQFITNNRVLDGRVWAGTVAAAGASISLSTESGELIATTVSNSNGQFSFNNLPSGYYLVRASLQGYRATQTDVDLASVNQTIATLILQPRRTVLYPAPSLGHYSLASKAKAGYLRAVKLLQENHFKKAIPALQSVVAAEPAFAPGYELMGEAYAKLRKPKQARQAWRKSLQLDPALIPAAVNLARYDNNHHHWKRALRRLQSANVHVGAAAAQTAAAKPAAAPRPWQWYWELGRAEYGSRHWRRAQAALARAETAGATPPNLHILLADLAVRGRHFPVARHEFELYLKTDPQGRFAKRARAIVKDMVAHHIPEPPG